jgi:hypothetical protein
MAGAADHLPDGTDALKAALPSWWVRKL